MSAIVSFSLTLRRIARRSVPALVATVVMLAAGASNALADQSWSPMHLRLTLIAHERPMPVLTKRYPAHVVSVGKPDANGNIYSVNIDITDLKENEVRSWRVTFFTGKLYGYVYQIKTNDSDSITVTSLDGPLNGVVKGDAMLIEEAPVTRPTPQNTGE